MLASDVSVRYLYQPGELEGGQRRATDPIWSLKVFNIEKSVTQTHVPCAVLFTRWAQARFRP